MNRQDIKELVLLISKLSKYYKQNRNFLQILIFYRKSRVIAAADFPRFARRYVTKIATVWSILFGLQQKVIHTLKK